MKRLSFFSFPFTTLAAKTPALPSAVFVKSVVALLQALKKVAGDEVKVLPLVTLEAAAKR